MLLNIYQYNSYDIYCPTELILRLLEIYHEVAGGQKSFSSFVSSELVSIPN